MSRGRLPDVSRRVGRAISEILSVYTGQVHRAYRAKDPVQLEQVEAGFDAISDEEMTELRDRWLGTRMSAWPWARYLVYVGVGGGVLVLGMMTWGMVLRRLVRQRTAALQDERRFLRILINTLPDLVWLKDEQGVYRLCNAGYEKYMGLPEAQIVGKRDEDFVDTEQARSFRQVDQRVMESGLSLVDERQVTYASDGHGPASNRSKHPCVTPRDASLAYWGWRETSRSTARMKNGWIDSIASIGC